MQRKMHAKQNEDIWYLLHLLLKSKASIIWRKEANLYLYTYTYICTACALASSLSLSLFEMRVHTCKECSLASISVYIFCVSMGARAKQGHQTCACVYFLTRNELKIVWSWQRERVLNKFKKKTISNFVVREKKSNWLEKKIIYMVNNLERERAHGNREGKRKNKYEMKVL